MKKLICFLLLPITCLAQVSFQVEPREIGINEYISFTVVIENSDGGRFPDFPQGLDGGSFQLNSRTPNTSYSMSNINGKMTSIRKFTYVLTPTKKGALSFPAQTVRFQGKLHQSEPVTITVGDEKRNVRQRRRNDPFGDFFSRQPSRSTTRNRQQGELFAEASVPKTDYYLGEGVPFEIKLVRTRNVKISNEGSSMDLPGFEAFWSEEVDQPTNWRTVRRDNRAFEELVVHKRILYPTRVGELTIAPAKFNLAIPTRGFGFFTDYQQARRQTEPITLTVKPLPQQGRPVDFSGYVGSFFVNGELDNNECSVGESVNFRIDISGEGNFSAISELALVNLPESMEVFDGGTPTTKQTAGRTTSKSWAFALVPKQEGAFEIPLPAFSFFDPKTSTYKSAPARVFKLNVLPGQGLGPALSTGDVRGREWLAEQNISYIKMGDLGPLNPIATPWHPRLLMILIGLFIVLGLVTFTWRYARQQGLLTAAGNRPKQALRNFKKQTAALPREPARREAFYSGLSQAVLNYFGDKWQRSGQGISLDEIERRFQKEQIDQDIFQLVAELIETCNFARFTKNADMKPDAMVDKALKTIKAVEEVMP